MSFASPTPASAMLKDAALASVLKCSKRVGQADYYIQGLSSYGVGDNSPSFTYIDIPSGYDEQLTYWDATGTPARSDGGAAMNHSNGLAAYPPQPGYWSAASWWSADILWTWRTTANLAWVEHFMKFKLTGPCQGTILQYPALKMSQDWLYSYLPATMSGQPPVPGTGAVGFYETAYPTSAVDISLTPGGVIEFWPTATPSGIDGDGFAWIPQACFYFNKHPSDFGM
jgi:hypothetical protein